MTQPSTRRSVVTATLALLTIAAAACGRSSPVAPEPAASRTEAAAIAPTALSKPGPTDSAIFPLSGGTFTISGRKGDEVSGVYSGQTVDTDGVSVTTVTLEVHSGTGALQGASGQLQGKGTGAFIGEGGFALEVSGFVSTDEKKNVKIGAAISGSSSVACESGQVIVRLDGGGPNVLQHQVGNAGCF